MIDKLTLNEGKGIKAHIIPKAFYHLDSKNSIPCMIIGENKNFYPKKCFTGIYDSNIVTAKGEAILQKLDNYSDQLLIKNFGSVESIFNNSLFKINLYDYHKLKLFFLSVLWRASVSHHYFFKKISLGNHEEIIRKAILQHDAGDSNFYSVVLSKFDQPENKVPFLDSIKCRIDGINCYKMYIYNFMALIKVDSNRVFLDPLKSFCMQEGNPLYIVTRDFKNSKERQSMKKILIQKGVSSYKIQ